MNQMKKYIVLDTETCNSIGAPLAYDIGWAIVDRTGTVYKTRSFVVKEIFFGERSLMRSAYYANKIPQYFEDIKSGKRIVAKFSTIMDRLLEDRAKYRVENITAHNARFDKRALENTSLYLLKSDFYLPTITNILDTQAMAKDTICGQKKYERFCRENNLLTKTGRIPQNAETLYKYITGNLEFAEKHTGLEDVMIEKEILVKCLAQHKAMPKKLVATY